jgi:hypothetical protein
MDRKTNWCPQEKLSVYMLYSFNHKALL